MTNSHLIIKSIPFTSTKNRTTRKIIAITFFFPVFLCYGVGNTYAMHNGDEEEQGAVGGGEEERREHLTQRLLQEGLQLPGDLEREFLFNLLAGGDESAALNLLEGEGHHIYFETPDPHTGNKEEDWVHQPLRVPSPQPQQGLLFPRQVSIQSGDHPSGDHPYTSIPHESGGSEHVYASLGSRWGTIGGRGTPYSSPIPTLQRGQQQLDEETSTCCMRMKKRCCDKESTVCGRIRSTCCGGSDGAASDRTESREPQQGHLGGGIGILPIMTQPAPVNDEGRSGAKKKPAPGALMQQLLDEKQSQAGRRHQHYRRLGGQTQHVLEEEGAQGTHRESCPSCRSIFSRCFSKTCCGKSRHDAYGTIEEGGIQLEERNISVVSSGSTPSEERRSLQEVLQETQEITQASQVEAAEQGSQVGEREPIYVNADPTQGPGEEPHRESCPSCRNMFSWCIPKKCCGKPRHDEHGTSEEGMQLEEMNVATTGPEPTPSEGRGSLQDIPQPLQGTDQASQVEAQEPTYGNAEPLQGADEGMNRGACPSCRNIFLWCLPKKCCGESRHNEHGTIEERASLTHGSGEAIALAVLGQGDTTSRGSAQFVGGDTGTSIGEQGSPPIQEQPRAVSGSLHSVAQEEDLLAKCSNCKNKMCNMCTFLGAYAGGTVGSISGFFLDHCLGSAAKVAADSTAVIATGLAGKSGMVGCCIGGMGGAALGAVAAPFILYGCRQCGYECSAFDFGENGQDPRGESRHDEHGTIEERASLTHGSGEAIALAVLGQGDTASRGSAQFVGGDTGTSIGEQGSPPIQEQPRAVSGSLHCVAQEEDLLAKCSNCKNSMCNTRTAIGAIAGGAACASIGALTDHMLGSAVKVAADSTVKVVAGVAGHVGMVGCCIGAMGGAVLGAAAAPMILYGCKKCGYECSAFDFGENRQDPQRTNEGEERAFIVGGDTGTSIGEQGSPPIQEQPRAVDGQNHATVQENVCLRAGDMCPDIFIDNWKNFAAGFYGCGILGCLLDYFLVGLNPTTMYTGIAGANGLVGAWIGMGAGGVLCTLTGCLCKECLSRGCKCPTDQGEGVNRGSQEAMQPTHSGGEGSGDLGFEDETVAGPSGIQTLLSVGSKRSGNSRRQSSESQNSSTQSSSGSSVSSQSSLGLSQPITKQPSSAGRPRVDLQHDMIPGYTPGGHISSLLGMQCVLGTTSLQVANTLRLLSLKAHETMPQNTQLFSFGNASTTRSQKGGRYSKKSKQILSTNRPHATYAMFGFMDSYTSNLERKVRAGRAGFMTKPNQRWSIGLSYNRHTDESKEYKGIQFRSAYGFVKTKTNIEGLSAVIAFNPVDKGLSGHLATCHGWGKLKNTREFTHAGVQASAKGSPKVQLRGGLIQLGYTIPLSKTVLVTPYIETMFSIVRWNGYKESSSFLSCEISRNQEKVLERSIGIRNHWEITDTSQVQVWGSTILGNKRVSALTSNPIQTTRIRYQTTVPSQRKVYTRTEIGLSYETNITEDLQISLNGRTRFEKGKDAGDTNIQWSLRYGY